MIKQRKFFLIASLFLIFCLSPVAFADYEIDHIGELDLPAKTIIDPLDSLIGHREEDLTDVYDEEGNYIFGSCMGISVGDRYINEDNHEYEVIKVEDGKAVARDKGKIELLSGEALAGSIDQLPPLVQGKDSNKLVGLYHTHSAESYAPGPAFKPERGEIYDVGAMLKEQLEKKGIKVVQSEESFLPHDGAAYERSRGTAAALLKDGASAIFDVHRDAIPRANEYMTKVKGQEMSKIRLVVGRQNPNMNTNEELAKRLKAVADKKYPGLIKGIFYAKGKYNQDLSPRALLFEFGTHVTTEQAAAKSTADLADTINTVLYGTNASLGGGEQGTDRAMGSASWTNLLWVLGGLIVVGVGYLLLNEKGLSGVGGRLKEFTGEEFANILGRNRKKEKKRDKNSKRK